MIVKEETPVRINLTAPKGSISLALYYEGNIFREISSLEVFKPGIYQIIILNYSKTPVPFTFSIKKTTEIPDAESIKFSYSHFTMSVGEVFKPKTENTPYYISVIKAKWSSSNKKVATVSQKGYITAKRMGKSTITAKIKGQKAVKCTVYVIDETLYLKNKSSKNLSKPVEVKDKDIKWSSSNEKVATVSKKGKVTLKKVGYSVIKAKVGNKTYGYRVISYDFNKLAKKAKRYLEKEEFQPNLKIKSILCGVSDDPSWFKGCPMVFLKYTSDQTGSETRMLYVIVNLQEHAEKLLYHMDFMPYMYFMPYMDIMSQDIIWSKLKKGLKKVETINPSKI